MSPEQFTSLYRGFLPQISSYLARRVETSEVEELASQVFEIAWRKRSQSPEGFELAWLYRIAGFVVSNHRRAVQSEKNFLLRFRSNDFAPAAEDIALSDLDLSKAWKKLSSFEREAISLTAFEGLSHQDAARVLEISPNAFTQRVAKARKKLKANLSVPN
ncbi:MAG: sigma-70 family RNA polymerase sigma factor [Rhodoluna sp.]